LSAPKLTIGMATYDDFDGCYFTLQSLRLHHDLSQVELIVVDNKPDSPASAELKQKIEGWMQPRTAGARYVPFGEAVGPALAKDRVFRLAHAPAVLCIDSHVLLPPGAIEKLIAWYDAHPDSRDLVQGPLLLDHLAGVQTHFIDHWRGEMWGIWGSAWEVCPGGDRVSVVDNGGRAQFLALEMGGPPLTHSSACGTLLPDIPFARHEQALLAAGWRQLGLDDGDEFDIPGQGMGLFSCRRDAWPGFNPHFRGFGGEEMYLHEKVRQRGGRTLCLGFLKWLHKFARPGGVKYPLTRWNKVRNYVLGHQELGLPLDRLHEHFVGGKLFGQADWDALVADPVSLVNPPQARPLQTVAEIYEKVQSTPWSLDQHMPQLAELAGRCEHVTEFSHTKESLVALAHGLGLVLGRLPALIAYNTQASDPLVKKLHELLPAIVLENSDSPGVAEIDETDLLFIDTRHTKARLAEELAKFAPRVRRYIVLHDTSLYGQRGEDGGAGLLEAIRELLESDSSWFVASHASKQYGLTVLGRLPEDRPEKPIQLWPPGFGPGTELKKLLATLGIATKPSCDCNAKATQMDVWGADGCRERREEIITWMREGQGRWGWKEKVSAATKAVTTGLAFKLNPLDPFPSLIDEAIRLAEQGKAAA